jgi:UDP-glucose 4-epimerase
MAILVTGGSGYIGSVTVDCLLSKGEQVVVLDDVARGHRQALDKGIPLYEGNAGDSTLVARIVREHPIDSCIHFAALAYVGESVSEPALYFERNVAQGIALMGTLVHLGIRRFVFSSSCATYGEPDALPIQERCRQWPKNPYGWSKLMLERVLDAYDTAYGLRFVALRYFNAAGATEKRGEHHDPEPHLIPNVLSAAAGELGAVTVFGDDYPTPDHTAIRDYIHVSDLAEAHALALNYLRKGGPSEFLNLGTGHGYSVLEVVECARKVTGRNIPVQMHGRRPGDPASLVADASRANSVLGWTPKTSDLHSILQSAWNWRQQHPHGYEKD